MSIVDRALIVIANGDAGYDEGALIGRTKPTPQPPGRGRIVSRELGEQVLQLAWQPPRLG